MRISNEGININDKELVCLTPHFTPSTNKNLNFYGMRIVRYCGVYFWLWLNLLDAAHINKVNLHSQLFAYLNFITFC